MAKTQSKAAPAAQQQESTTQQEKGNYDVRIQSIKADRNVLATATVNVCGIFAVRGVKVMEGSKGPFVSLPSYKVGDDYKDICFPCTKKSRQEFNETVMDAYQQALAQVHERSSQGTEKQTPAMSQTM